ncbi:hypothetical protein GYMLUDRAFT_47680, partial [Collybiopsis luxurians FD-317 M1]
MEMEGEERSGLLMFEGKSQSKSRSSSGSVGRASPPRISSRSSSGGRGRRSPLGQKGSPSSSVVGSGSVSRESPVPSLGSGARSGSGKGNIPGAGTAGRARRSTAVSQHDLMNRYFRRDMVIFRNLDL